MDIKLYVYVCTNLFLLLQFNKVLLNFPLTAKEHLFLDWLHGGDSFLLAQMSGQA